MESVTFRSWPKLIFAWPTALAALFCGFATQVDAPSAKTYGMIFLVIFATNLMVLGFEFSRTISLILFFAFVTVLVSTLWINQSVGFLAPVQKWLSARSIQGHHEFFYAFGAIYLLMFFCMFVRTRFDYWQLTSNELIHKKGFLGKSERFSTQRLRLTKEIPDVFEYLFGGAGQIVIHIPGRTPVILENVMGIKRVEAVSDKLLDARVVRVQPQAPQFPAELLEQRQPPM